LLEREEKAKNFLLFLFLGLCGQSEAEKQMGRAGAQSEKGVLPTRTRGFSLLELLLVVAIILVIAAMAIPNFLRSRIAANESSAVQSLRRSPNTSPIRRSLPCTATSTNHVARRRRYFGRRSHS